jgi:hypothetical protein
MESLELSWVLRCFNFDNKWHNWPSLLCALILAGAFGFFNGNKQIASTYFKEMSTIQSESI